VTGFSSRPGTRAAGFYDIPDRFKKDWSWKATNLWLEIAGRRNRRHLGKVMDVLVTEHGREYTSKARSPSYGEVVVQGVHKLRGILRVKVIDACLFYLVGKALM
jgi:tRNA A37 methylthiotransferase MiaB